MPTTADDFDIIDVEVHQKSIRNIAQEMGITLMRTSGSPVVTDAGDFSTAILDAGVEQLAFAGNVTFHVSTSIAGVEAVLRYNDIGEIRPGDGFICNDPHTSGAIHQGDVGIVMPFFGGDEILGWGYVNEHVLDIGGSAVSGFAAGAFDNFAEALAFPAVRVIREGRIEKQWERFIANNVRMAGTVINDIRSMIAANNVGAKRFAALVENVGKERFQRLNDAAKDLSERAMRDLIRRLPDGTYESIDWVEYDGRGKEELHQIRARLLISGDEMMLQFRGVPQTNSFINGAWPAVVGQSWTTVLAQLAHDIPINAGLWRPVTFDLGPEGSIVNAVRPAPVTMSHIQTGMRVNKLLTDVISQACSFSEYPEIRGRVAGQPAQDQTYFTAFGVDRRNGSPTVCFPMSVGMSDGGGAQTNHDGMEIYAAQCMSGCAMPDVEQEEVSQPGMILWRRIKPDSGGPGVQRGGMGVDTNLAILHCEEMTGGAYTNTALIPPRGSAGGYPGSSASWETWRNTNLVELIENGGFPDEANITADIDARSATVTDFQLKRGDIYRVRHGGGGGIGDPIRRLPDSVAQDVRDGFVSEKVARGVYGVALAEDGTVNTIDTAKLRSGIREKRIGKTPPCDVAEDAPLYSPLRVRDQEWECTQCSQKLGPSAQNWRDSVPSTDEVVSDRFPDLGLYVRTKKEGEPVVVREHFCPGCASVLSVDISMQNMGPVPQSKVGTQDPFSASLLANR